MRPKENHWNPFLSIQTGRKMNGLKCKIKLKQKNELIFNLNFSKEYRTVCPSNKGTWIVKVFITIIKILYTFLL